MSIPDSIHQNSNFSTVNTLLSNSTEPDKDSILFQTLAQQNPTLAWSNINNIYAGGYENRCYNLFSSPVSLMSDLPVAHLQTNFCTLSQLHTTLSKHRDPV